MQSTPPSADPWVDRSPLLDLAIERLPAFLMRQRWYPAKDAGVPVVSLAALIPFEVPGWTAAIVLWDAAPPGRPPLRLFLPLAVAQPGEAADTDQQAASANGDVIAPLDTGGSLIDAFGADEFVRAFVRGMLRHDTAGPGVLRPGHTARAFEAGLDEAVPWRIRRSSAEQSNTSIRIGDTAILKVIRKPLEGIHPELEMGRFLTDHAHFGAIPALLGWVELDGSTLAVLQAFVPNHGDGWGWVLEHLRGESPAEDAAVLRWVRKLGVRTAQMHGALAGPTDDPAFAPAPVAAQDWDGWIEDMEARARRAREAFHARPQAGAGARLVREFEERSLRLPQILRECVRDVPAWVKTRHHGDYHLGQVLVTDDDLVIVDFEGEPLRPLEERRAKHVPLRDVAGMLRSFAYAAAVAERETGADERLRRWASAASAAFLDAYVSTLSESAPAASTASDHHSTDAAALRRLVRFFTIEKALYEVSYELANRPDWLHIPLADVTELLGEGAGAATRRMHLAPQGAQVLSGGGVRFRIWAPGCERIGLALQVAGGELVRTLTAEAEGWHELTVPEAGAGSRYQYVLPDGLRVPDPASRFQPDDVHGPSEVVDPTGYAWRDGAWAGRSWHDAVVYELHVGTFTSAGTFRAAIERLEHLAALGVTAIEIMPVADFPGARNWGYDGVLLYAPDSSYGRPDDLKALVEAAHARGLMVLLDVVYNHFGPDGNYLPVYAPSFFTDRHKTPWGAAVNYDGPHSRPVREFVVHNALHWIEEYNLDGLRLDAVHAIIDDGPRHLLDELAERVRAVKPHARLILENEENEPRWLTRDASGRPPHFTAQWNDDLHHVLHVAATGERQGYYADYVEDTDKLGRALAEGFAFQGQMMEFRGAPRGSPSASLPPDAFIAFAQNHDQIGNRAFGERINAIAPPEAVRAIAAVYLLLPQIPMLFMGEEWGADQPFPFFCDFDGELAEAVRRGRREEFAKFPEFQDEAQRSRIPDPQAAGTFESAKLRWAELEEPAHAAWHDFYRRLLSTRRNILAPRLKGMAGHCGRYEVLGPGAVVVRWTLADAGELVLAANLSRSESCRPPPAVGRVLWQEGPALSGEGIAAPYFVRWSLT